MSRIGSGAVLVGLCAVAAAAAAAQEPRPYQPAFDVKDYSLTIELPDSGALIKAKAAIVVVRAARSETLTLDLLDLTVERVLVDGKPVRFARTDTSIGVPMPPKRVGASYLVRVEYGGAVKDGLIARRDSAGRWTYFGDNWPNRARHWIPSIDHPSDKATVSWRVIAPEAQTVVANGRLITRRVITDAGRRRAETFWRESRPIAPYLMVIAAAPLAELDVGETACGLAEGQRCVPQAVYAAPEQRGFLPGPFARVGEMVQLFGRLVGPFPYEKLYHLQSETRFGGMENASAIFYSDQGFRRGTLRDGTVAHETAHQWFGDAVTEREWSHLWLSEGFATYFSALWTRAARGDSAFRDEMAGIRRTILRDTVSVTKRPVIDTIETNLMSLLNRNSYEKGGFVLHMLRQQVGERAFFEGIGQYYRKHRHATALTDDLRAEMERASGQRLAWFFDQWLRRPGYPGVEASWSYDAAAGVTTVIARQSGSFGEYEFPLTVSVVDSAGGRQRAATRMKPGAEPVQIRIPSARPPAAVILDPDTELLATLRVVP